MRPKKDQGNLVSTKSYTRVIGLHKNLVINGLLIRFVRLKGLIEPSHTFTFAVPWPIADLLASSGLNEDLAPAWSCQIPTVAFKPIVSHMITWYEWSCGTYQRCCTQQLCYKQTCLYHWWQCHWWLHENIIQTDVYTLCWLCYYITFLHSRFI